MHDQNANGTLTPTATAPAAAPAAASAAPAAAGQPQVDQPPVGLLLDPPDTFVRRHVGPDAAEQRQMLDLLGIDTLDDLIDETVPPAIRLKKPLKIGEPDGRLKGEHELLADLKKLASRNKLKRSLIGMGYHGTITPPVIQRNILENPGWYTQYTPYQAEISQGRLEALLNFQTMVTDLTGLPLANASLLDEATAAAEAMAMCRAIAKGKNTVFVSQDCHPQVIAVVQTRADSMGINCVVGDVNEIALPEKQVLNRSFVIEKSESAAPVVKIDDVCGVIVSYPTTSGEVRDHRSLTARVHHAGGLVVVCADLLALTLLQPPGEWGADIVVGNTQRFGVPMGFGGPHAAYMATAEKHARKMPGRLVGVSHDRAGNRALRLAIQTREQHIKREKATSNICTAQVLLAIMAGMYATYHGPDGLKRIAMRVHLFTGALAEACRDAGHQLVHERFFDTLRIRLKPGTRQAFVGRANKSNFNLRYYENGDVGLSLDEETDRPECRQLIELFTGQKKPDVDAYAEAFRARSQVAERESAFLTHPVFNTYHSETELLRYITTLQKRDLSLTHSMIPLGSCTMKLNATSEMLPVTWPEFGKLHPFAPDDQTRGYQAMFKSLEKALAEITGFPGVSLQPNAGSQGEYAGLLTIRAFHHARGQAHRNVCLIPESAHGTNPASAVIAGMQVVVVQTLDNGDIDLEDLKNKAEQHKENLAALMITYPSTHGVFEREIKKACKLVKDRGGRVYMDGANMNAQVGITSPAACGADVVHLNLHKTFCIPHGGGGPGMGPICCTKELRPYLPAAPVQGTEARRHEGTKDAPAGAVSAAAYGSASILPISWVYIYLMGGVGLTRATQVAILNANYMARRLSGHFEVLYAGKKGRVAHEFILDCRAFDKEAGVTVEDIAKRLMDYGFHAPTMSWPVAGTLMIEPTESESKPELDRFCDALIAIRQEIADVAAGKLPRDDNPLKHAPHTADVVTAVEWPHAYTREQAAFPLPWVKQNKFWTAVGRIDNAYGDRNLVCTCPPVDSYQPAAAADVVTPPHASA